MRHPDEAYAKYLHDDCLCQVKDKDGKNLIQWGEEWKQQRDELLAAVLAYHYKADDPTEEYNKMVNLALAAKAEETK